MGGTADSADSGKIQTSIGYSTAVVGSAAVVSSLNVGGTTRDNSSQHQSSCVTAGVHRDISKMDAGFLCTNF